MVTPEWVRNGLPTSFPIPPKGKKSPHSTGSLAEPPSAGDRSGPPQEGATRNHGPLTGRNEDSASLHETRPQGAHVGLIEREPWTNPPAAHSTRSCLLTCRRVRSQDRGAAPASREAIAGPNLDPLVIKGVRSREHRDTEGAEMETGAATTAIALAVTVVTLGNILVRRK